MPRPRIIVLCGRSPRHLYVANRLCEAADVQAIVHETGGWSVRKLRRLLNPKTFWQKAWRWLRDRRRYTGGGEAQYFFGDRPAALDHPERVTLVPTVNDPAVVELVDRIQPDYVAVFGTTLIREPLLGRATLLNLHGGLSPDYRGADCTFWALHNGEPEQVGCTLHFIDAGIDTGRLIAHVCPAVHPDDDELRLFWRAVRDSAEVYARMLERLSAGEPIGEHQARRGRLYRVSDRTLRSERALAERLQREPLPELPPRIRWFGGPAAARREAQA
ncbi:formyl transferase [Sediminicurvatus halobius]|uniref:phosphoribosylglycinamide formyltransferase 1 n=1 Tax=Sediminicurvatus halobius TaxID=2182432 RepID=A0A2U2N0V3_9GAMM|nr:formyl transferase [Spiribacter halobius]PWG62677.1 formyl transferase [Spiribacter halobius]UEX77346.1 formyl transferase [Spiribacter halobius]